MLQKKTQNVTKLRKNHYLTKLTNYECDQTQKLKSVAKLRHSKCDKTKKHKIRQNSKTLDLTKLKSSQCDHTQEIQIITKLRNLIWNQNGNMLIPCEKSEKNITDFFFGF